MTRGTVVVALQHALTLHLLPLLLKDPASKDYVLFLDLDSFMASVRGDAAATTSRRHVEGWC